jgi:hypothetical protein
MSLGSTQPLTEMSTKSISWGKSGRCVRLTTWPPYCAVVKKSGNFNFLEPSGPLRPVKGLLYLLYILRLYILIRVDRVAQTVWRLTTAWTVRVSNPVGGEIFRAFPDRSWGPSSLLYNGYGSFQGVKCGRGVLWTIHPLLLPRSWNSKAITLPTLWATPGVLRGYCTFTYVLVYIPWSLYSEI